MKTIGLIINPVAGIGGKVGLKGSDGSETLKKALELGAVPESGKKALVALKRIKEVERDVTIYTYPGEMGEDICKEAGLDCRVIGEIRSGATGAADTKKAAKELAKYKPDLILFAGGDGTARDVLDAIGTEVPVLGIPTGCKIHSGVYALNPRSAGSLICDFAKDKIKSTKEAEVMDIDEDLFRQGEVRARLYGYLRVPNEKKRVQNLKSGRGHSEEGALDLAANYIVETMEPDTLYIIGTGSTTAFIMKKLGLPNTLLGADLVYNNAVVASDCTERQILGALNDYDKVKIIVTVIGGQGYIFGRGNQQISAEVIKRVGKENIIIVATEDKMMSMFGRPLYVDTGDEEVNAYLRGYMRVVMGYEKFIVARVSD